MVYTTSTPSLANTLRRTNLDLQTQLSQAQVEVSTGRVADLSLSLGRSVAQDYSLGISSDELQSITQSNGVVSSRLDTTDAALSSIASSAQTFLETLVGAQSGAGTDPSRIASAATESLKSLISGLNTTVGGVYVFGGINSGIPPITDYFATPPSASKQAVDAAFSTAFGMSQTSAGVNSITASQMQAFLAGALANLFSSASWGNDWSAASTQPLQNRISLSQTTDMSISANDPALQKLAMAYTMVADLGAAGLSASAFQEVVKTASATMSSAISELTAVRASVGIMQQNLKDANQTISVQRNAIDVQIGSLENVDPYEASTRLSNLTTQLETSYTITGKIQQLTLAKYI